MRTTRMDAPKMTNEERKRRTLLRFLYDTSQWEEGDEIWIKGEQELNRTSFATDWSTKEKQGKEVPGLPAKYQRHWRVFDEELSNAMPPDRGEFNNHVKLVPGAPNEINSKIYPLSRKEEMELNEFLDKGLKNGKISRTITKYASPFFFIRKKDGSL